MTGLPLIPGHTCSAANGVNADGSVVVGQAWTCSSGGNYKAFSWDNGVVTALGFLMGDSLSNANGVSGDGTIIVGISFTSGGPGHAVKWVNGTISGLVVLPGDLGSNALGISQDGSTIVGYSSSDPFGVNAEAVRWVGVSVEGLGILPGDTYSYARAVNNDGSVVVGTSGNGGNQHAFQWNSMTGIQSVADWLGPTVDLTGISLLNAPGVSADGSAIVGNMVKNGSTKAFLARNGGLISPDEVAESFAAIAAATTHADDAVDDIVTNGRECRRFGPRDLCVFGEFRTAFANDDDLRLTGTGGVVRRIGNMGRIGMSAGYLKKDFDIAIGGEVSMEAPIASVFAGWGAPDESGFQFFTSAAFARFNTDITRGYANGAGTACSNGETTIDSTALHGRIAYGIKLGTNSVAGPFAEVTAVQSQQDGYSETGGPFPAKFEARDDTSVIARFGLNTNIAISPDLQLTLFGNWAIRPYDDADPVAGNFEGALGALTVPILQESNSWAEASALTTFLVSDNASIYVGVSGKFGYSSLPDVSARIGFKAEF